MQQKNVEFIRRKILQQTPTTSSFPKKFFATDCKRINQLHTFSLSELSRLALFEACKISIISFITTYKTTIDKKLNGL